MSGLPHIRHVSKLDSVVELYLLLNTLHDYTHSLSIRNALIRNYPLNSSKIRNDHPLNTLIIRNEIISIGTETLFF